jgi:hypothetical protein
MNILCPTSNMPTTVRSKPKIIQPCTICESFMTDWLLIPLVQSDYLFDKIHYKRLKRIAKELAKEFCQIQKKINPLVEYMMTRNIEKYKQQIIKEIVPDDFPQELLPECIWISTNNIAYFKSFDATDFKTDIDYICVRLEEDCVCKHIDFVYEFVGYCLQHAMLHLPNLHQEHCGTKPASYAGPPIGMKVVELQNPLQNIQTKNIYVALAEHNFVYIE